MMSKFWSLSVSVLITAFLLGCNSSSSSSGGGGDSGGSGGGSDTNTARIAGSVTLSSSVAGSNKPIILQQKTAAGAPQFKVTAENGFRILQKPALNSTMTMLNLMNVGDPVSDAWVYLYDAEHPEWLAPVAQDVTNSSGEYEFSVYGCTADVSSSDCVADDATNGNAYTDGDPLPQGVYTMLVYKPSRFDPILGITTDPIVSVLPAFKADSENIAVEQAEAEVSDVTPNVVSMFGQPKNTDGTDTWGDASVEIPLNNKIQVTFDMAMSRGSVQNITVSNGTAVAGSWSLSADWKTATFVPDANLAAETTYSVTVPSTTANVYSNSLGYKAVGTFTTGLAENVDSTAPVVSFVSPATTTNVKATTALRLTSNEVLNVNSIRVDSAPSIGDFPGIVLVKKDNGAFIYEVDTTESLTLGTSYSITISGIEDGAGNAATDLSLSFTTEAAADAAGVDATANSETQNAQVAISEIFEQWILAVNDRNSAAISSLMSGSFVFEYNVQAEDGFREEDVNRNGRLSLKEFMSMIEQGMLQWEFCGTTVSGNIIDTVNIASADSGNFEFMLNFTSDNLSQDCNDDSGESIYASVKNINGLWKLSRMSEGFDHRGTTLTSMSLIEAQLYEVADNAEGESLVANWQQMNNFADNQTPLTFRFTHVTGVESYVFLIANEKDPARMGFAFVASADRLACGTDNQCTAQDGDELEISVPDPQGANGMPAGAYPVVELFGFDSDIDWGIENPGETFMWEVIGLGSLTPQQMTNEQSPPQIVDIVRDIEAVSAVKRFQNPGEYVELMIEVSSVVDPDFADLTQPDNSGNEIVTPLQYSIYNHGYDAMDASWVEVAVTSPDADGTLSEAWFYAYSPIGWGEYPVTYVPNGDGTSTAMTQMLLFNGWTHIEVSNGVSRWEFFQVVTTGGRAPDVAVTNGQVTGTVDAAGTPSTHTLALDEWNFIDASGNTGVDVSLAALPGGVDTVDVAWTIAAGDGIGSSFDIDDAIEMLTDSLGSNLNACNPSVGWVSMDIYVHNNDGAYYSIRACTDDGQGNRTPSGDILISGDQITLTADLPVFNGDNWISLNIWADDGSGSAYYQTHSSFGVYTDAGSEFVAPIAIATELAQDGVTEVPLISTSLGTLTEIGNWGQGSDWDASAVTIDEFGVIDSTVTVSFEFPAGYSGEPMVWVGADGIWGSDAALVFNAGTGFYDLTFDLYLGYNWINVDDGQGNWYSLNIFTEYGREVPRPKFLTANGVDIVEPADPYAQLEVVVDQCLITVTGNAPENTKRLWVNWSGGDGMEGFWEGMDVSLAGNTGQPQDWEATFQLVSGANAYNQIDVYDETNQTGAWLSVRTTAAGCTYTPPVTTVVGVRLADQTELVQDDYQRWGMQSLTQGFVDPVLDNDADPLTAVSAFVYGTTTTPGRFIGIQAWMCGGEVKFGANASTTANAQGTYNWQVEFSLFDDNDQTSNGDNIWPFNQYMNVNDGYNWSSFEVLSDTNNLPPPPAMSLNMPSEVTEWSQPGCDYVQWDGSALTTSLQNLTITGQTTNQASWGGFGQAYMQNGWVDFAIDAAGNFSVTVPLFDGWNYINFDDMHGGFFAADIFTANGQLPPQYVYINLADGVALDTTSTGVANAIDSNAVTISGDFGASSFAPDWLSAWVEVCDIDYLNCVYTNYDSELQVANEYGDQPMSYDPQFPENGFSLDVNIPDGTYYVYVDVSGCGPDGCHGHSFRFNDGGSEDNYFYKPGQRR